MTTVAVALATGPFSMLLLRYNGAFVSPTGAQPEQTPSRHASADVAGVSKKTVVEFNKPRQSSRRDRRLSPMSDRGCARGVSAEATMTVEVSTGGLII
ncbi:hypothetical protein F5B21DRAFT_474308 [Xylaria acuta]|nr:hypothetical protein F5B21DRAFT_474308 [Xylaria acuta]